MLAVTANYLATQEARRHNFAMELETHRSNRAQEALRLKELQLESGKISETLKQNQIKLAQDRWYNERFAEINARNAYTNRLNAINTDRRYWRDYSLGLQANEIARLNAESSMRNSYANQSNANVNAQNYALNARRTDADIYSTYANVNFAGMNAATNRMRAQNEYEMNQYQANRYQFQNMNDTINTMFNAAESTTRMYNNVARGMATMNSFGG